MVESAFDVETPEDSPGFLLWQTTVIWQRKIKKALDPYGIAHAQFVVLAILLWYETQKQQPTQVLLANQSKLDKMTVSKSLKKLVQLGLVKRSEDEQDTRAKNVSLSSKGKALAYQLVKAVGKVDREFFDHVSSSEQKSLTRLFVRLVAQKKGRD